MSQRMSTRVLQVTERRHLPGAETPTRGQEVDASADPILSPEHFAENLRLPNATGRQTNSYGSAT